MTKITVALMIILASFTAGFCQSPLAKPEPLRRNHYFSFGYFYETLGVPGGGGVLVNFTFSPNKRGNYFLGLQVGAASYITEPNTFNARNITPLTTNTNDPNSVPTHANYPTGSEKSGKLENVSLQIVQRMFLPKSPRLFVDLGIGIQILKNDITADVWWDEQTGGSTYNPFTGGVTGSYSRTNRNSNYYTVSDSETVFAMDAAIGYFLPIIKANGGRGLFVKAGLKAVGGCTYVDPDSVMYDGGYRYSTKSLNPVSATFALGLML